MNGPHPSNEKSARQFVSEPIRPDRRTFDTARMATGEPGLPAAFQWRDRTVRIASVLRAWRETGACRHGSGERYVRRHWYEIRTDSGQTMQLYCDRHARPGDNKRRWWLFSVEDAGAGNGRAAPLP